MRSNLLIAITAACCIGLTAIAHAGPVESPDTVVSESAGFEISQSVLTEDSKSRLNSIISDIDSVLRNDRIISMSVSGSSSPDGPAGLNMRLSERRAGVVRDYIVRESGLAPESFAINAKGEDWERFEALVRQDASIPMRDALLKIIGSSKSAGQKEAEMRRLGNGRIWSYLAANIFPAVRVAVVDVRYRNSPPMQEVISMDKTEETFILVPASEEQVDLTLPTGDTPVDAPANVIIEQPEWQRHAYVKTNMPAWLMLWINAAGEIDIAPHWSANLSIYYAGYNYFKSNLKFRNFSVMPEVRYWPLARNNGFFVGAHFGMAYYNVAFCGDKRYQDHDGNTPALGGGINVGYRFRLPRNPRWQIEFSVGAGAYRLDYDIFDNRHDGLLVGREKRTFFGIDNAAFSICYTFDVNGKGGAR